MADILISYKREDFILAKSLAGMLSELGWTVWWDHDIPAGKDYDQTIEEELASSKCVIVLWSALSVNSRNVKDEANEALKRNVLIPILIGDIRPPLGFRMIQAIKWNENNEIQKDEFDELVNQVKRLIGDAPLGKKILQNKKLSEAQQSYNRQDEKAVDHKIQNQQPSFVKAIPVDGSFSNSPGDASYKNKRKGSLSVPVWGVVAGVVILVFIFFMIKLNNGESAKKYNDDKVNNRSNNVNVSPPVEQKENSVVTNAPEVSKLPGRFPQASERLLSIDDLNGLNKYQLKIMRNEIFARHGFIFKTVEMKTHFSRLPWYNGRYSDVTSLLSDIEKQNIALIRSYE